MKLCIPLKIWQRISGYAFAALPCEVTGFGTIKFCQQDLIVDEIFLPRQTASPVKCETVPGALNDLILDSIEDNPARAGALRFRWHSHGSSPAFWSPTDEADIAAWPGPWVVNLVMNISGEYLARFDIFQGVGIRNIPLDIHFIIPTPVEIQNACAEEVKTKVRKSDFVAHSSILDRQDLLKGGEIHAPGRLF